MSPSATKGASRISSWLESSIDQEVGTIDDNDDDIGNGNATLKDPLTPLSEEGTGSEQIKSPMQGSPVNRRKGESRISRPETNEVCQKASRD